MIDSRDLSSELLLHAATLMEGASRPVSETIARRAVSAAYYALFHRIVGDAVLLLAPNVPSTTTYRVQRWFDHSEMKRICGRFLPDGLQQPLLGLIGHTASADLRFVARSFIQLQNARHSADYDLGFDLREREVRQYLEQASEAFEAWRRLSGSAEANIFILSLLLWKNWEKERP